MRFIGNSTVLCVYDYIIMFNVRNRESYMIKLKTFGGFMAGNDIPLSRKGHGGLRSLKSCLYIWR